MKPSIESDLLVVHVNAFRISEHGDNKLEYWAGKEGRSKRGYLQHLIHNLPDIPDEVKGKHKGK